MKSKILFSLLCLPAFIAATNVDIPITLSTNTNHLTSIVFNAQNEYEIAIGAGGDPNVYINPLNTPYTNDVRYLSFDYQYTVGGYFEIFYYKPSNGSAPANIDPAYYMPGNYLIPTSASGWRTKVIDLYKETGWFDSQMFRFDFGMTQNANLKMKNIKLSNYQDLSKTLMFNYTMEDNLNDVSGKDNNALAGGTGAVTYDANGKTGKAASFDSQANWFESPINMFSIDNDFTIDLWVKIDENNTATYPTIIQQLGSTGRTILGLEKSTNKLFAFFGENKYFTTLATYNQWMHIVMVVQQTRQKLKVYVNDVFDSEFSGVAYTGNVTNDALRFAAHRNAAQYVAKDFMGLMDEVKLYNTSLSLFNINTSSNDIAKGTVSASVGALEGSEVTLTATPNGGNHFVNWTEGGLSVSTNPSYTFTSTANRTLVANFEQNTVSVSSGTTNATGISCSTCDVTVASGAELSINANKTLKSVTVQAGGKLTISGGSLSVSNGITLGSDANGTATLVDNTTDSPQEITATIQQYVTSGRNWYLSIPLSSGSSSLLSRGTSVICYDEPSGEWIAPTASTLHKLRGYIQTATTTPLTGTTGTVDFAGIVNTGTHSISLTRTLGKTGFNLVGNPYPSYLDWNAVTKTNVSNTMWYRTKEGGVYKFYTYVANSGAGVGSPASVTNKIPPMQAFWVRVNTVGTGSIAVDNTMRHHKDVDGNIMKAPNQSQQKLLRLQISNGINTDETVLYFNENALDTFDQYDAQKQTNEELAVPEVFTQIGAEQLVINGMKEIKYDTEIPIGFSTMQANNFSISANEISNFETGTRVILIDKLHPTLQNDLTNGTSYNFNAAITEPTTNRFSLLFRAPGVSTEIDNSTEKLNVQVFVNNLKQITMLAPEKCNYSIFNALGQIVNSGITSSNRTTINLKLQTGMYVVKISENGKSFSTRVVI